MRNIRSHGALSRLVNMYQVSTLSSIDFYLARPLHFPPLGLAGLSPTSASSQCVSCSCLLLKSHNRSLAILRLVRPKPSADAGTPGGRTQAISQDMKFDYRIAQASIFLDAMAYVLTIIAPGSSQVLFVCFTSLSSFTAGVNPAIHSLAVSYLFANGENANVGQMFGGMSMLQAVSHTLQVREVFLLTCDRMLILS
jgi:hypothetical protein